MENVPSMKAKRASLVPSKGRSKVTNRTSMYLDKDKVNGKDEVAMRVRDIIDSTLAEAGLTDPTDQELSLARRIAHITRALEAMDAAQARGEETNGPAYCRLIGTLRITRADLGLDDGPAQITGDDRDDLATIAADRGKALPKAKSLPSLANQGD